MQRISVYFQLPNKLAVSREKSIPFTKNQDFHAKSKDFPVRKTARNLNTSSKRLEISLRNIPFRISPRCLHTFAEN